MHTEHLPASVRHPGIALAVILACHLMVTLDATVVNIAMPSMKESLGFSPTGLSWVFSAYTLAFGGLLLLGGRAGDLFGGKTISRRSLGRRAARTRRAVAVRRLRRDLARRD